VLTVREPAVQNLSPTTRASFVSSSQRAQGVECATSYKLLVVVPRNDDQSSSLAAFQPVATQREQTSLHEHVPRFRLPIADRISSRTTTVNPPSALYLGFPLHLYST